MVADDKWQYGVVLDAGSSGTRIHIYRWLSHERALEDAEGVKLHSLPELTTHDEWTKKIHPGISAFGETPELVGTEHLEPLLQHARKYIPEASIAQTPVFLLATAGMRLLPDRQRIELLESVCHYFESETNFLVSDCQSQFQVISGETEGLYGWIAANYLLGGFDAPDEHVHGKGHHTYGFLDMGGASAQIAFAPNSTEAAKHANDLTLLRLRKIDGQTEEYGVFVTTWLGFGVHEARRRYVDALIAMYESEHPEEGGRLLEMPDPCLPRGSLMSLNGTLISDPNNIATKKTHLLGTGEFDECLHQTYPLLQKEVPCFDEPCLLNGVHVPAIDFDVNHFVGISEYWHTTHEIFEIGYKDKAYDFRTYQKRVRDFCQQDWSSIEAAIEDDKYGKKVDEQTAYEVCFKASWLMNILHEGIGIPRAGIEDTSVGIHNGTKAVLESGERKGYLDPFQAVNKIKSTEVSWTLGKMLLYASSDIPTSAETLPVGFGSNEPGIPTDFQYPGGGGVLLGQLDKSKLSNDPSSITDKLHDTLFRSDSSHRIPGFIFFFFIMLIGIFYLCGRERRIRYFGRFVRSSKRNRGFGSYIPLWDNRRDVNYDRVMESGQNLLDPAEFELGDVETDEAGSPRNGKSREGNGMNRKLAPAPISPEVVDRQGLAVRTESRERLDLAGGRKSRTGSPTRNKMGTAYT